MQPIHDVPSVGSQSTQTPWSQFPSSEILTFQHHMRATLSPSVRLSLFGLLFWFWPTLVIWPLPNPKINFIACAMCVLGPNRSKPVFSLSSATLSHASLHALLSIATRCSHLPSQVLSLIAVIWRSVFVLPVQEISFSSHSISLSLCQNVKSPWKRPTV